MMNKDQKSVVNEQFIQAKKLGETRKTSILQKIKNIESFSDLMEKINRKVIKNSSFVINNKIASLIYRKKILKFHSFYIDDNEVKTLLEHLISSKQLKLTDEQAKGKRGNENDQETNDKMNTSQTWFEIKKNNIYDNLICKVESSIQEYIQSPFAVVNLNAWKTKANMKVIYDEHGNSRGPNRFHQDGYPPGHYKCMIYLNPLDDDHGKIQVEDKIFESNKGGFCLCFNNNLYHQSIPGKSSERYVIEITLMRTIAKVDILKNYPGTPDSIHLKQAYQAYI